MVDRPQKTTACSTGLLLLLFLAGCSPHRSAPLWPGSKYSEADRSQALMRAITFIDRSARVPANFHDWASDYLYCFYSIAVTAKDPELRAEAARLAPEYAKRWAEMRPSVPANADAEAVADLAFGWLPASLLGQNDRQIKPEIDRAAMKFSPIDFLLFDPAKEPPPSDMPASCAHDHSQNPRGAKVCRKCGRPLTMRSKYSIWLDALITTYSGDRYGIRLGGSFPSVVRWVSVMRPYPDVTGAGAGNFIDAAYSITHLVYTLNDYGQHRVPRGLLEPEFAFLRHNIRLPIERHDPETMGEFLDSLKGLGMTYSDPEIRTGVTYLLDTQRADGTWSAPDEKDVYTLYHSAWTAIDGLKTPNFEGEKLSFPELWPILDGIR